MENKEPEKPREELITDFPIVRDPKYIYYVSSSGYAARVKKKGTVPKEWRKKSKKEKDYKMEALDLTIPKLMLKGYAFPKIKTIRKMGGSGAIFIPKEFIGRKYKVILVPLEDLEKGTELKEEELNLF